MNFEEALKHKYERLKKEGIGGGGRGERGRGEGGVILVLLCEGGEGNASQIEVEKRLFFVLNLGGQSLTRRGEKDCIEVRLEERKGGEEETREGGRQRRGEREEWRRREGKHGRMFLYCSYFGGVSHNHEGVKRRTLRSGVIHYWGKRHRKLNLL